MAGRTILHLTRDGLSCHPQPPSAATPPQRFSPTHDGLARFAEHLARHPTLRFTLLVDVPDEFFTVEPLPKLSAGDRRALLARRRERLAHETPYFTEAPLPALAGDAPADDCLFASLVRPDQLKPWLDALRHANAALTGIHSAPFAALPLRMGGCGTTSTLSLAPAARLAGRLAVAQGDDPWPLVLRDASEGAWCACGAVRVERGCSRCALCCAGERGAGVCGVCRDAILTAARSLPDARWGWVDGAAAAWRATTALPPGLVRGFVAIAGARKQPQRALHFASLQPFRARLLAAASPFVARRLESNAAVSARALYTFDGLASCPLSRAAFAYALRLRLTFPGATSIAPVACSCPSAGAGRRDDRRRRFAAAPGLLGARANDWHV